MVTGFGIKITLVSKYTEETYLFPEIRNGMLLMFAVAFRGVTAIVNRAFVLGLGCGDWDWAALRPALNPRTIWCFLILEAEVSQDQPGHQHLHRKV